MGGGRNEIDKNDGKRWTKNSKDLSKKDDIYHLRGADDVDVD